MFNLILRCLCVMVWDHQGRWDLWKNVVYTMNINQNITGWCSDRQSESVMVSPCHTALHSTSTWIQGGSYETALLELINFVIVHCNRRSVVEHQAWTWQLLAWFCGDIKIIAGLRKLKILFNDKSCIKSLLMTKNHHNDVYNTNKNISIYRNY